MRGNEGFQHREWSHCGLRGSKPLSPGKLASSGKQSPPFTEQGHHAYVPRPAGLICHMDSKSQEKRKASTRQDKPQTVLFKKTTQAGKIPASLGRYRSGEGCEHGVPESNVHPGWQPEGSRSPAPSFQAADTARPPRPTQKAGTRAPWQELRPDFQGRQFGSCFPNLKRTSFLMRCLYFQEFARNSCVCNITWTRTLSAGCVWERKARADVVA